MSIWGGWFCAFNRRRDLAAPIGVGDATEVFDEPGAPDSAAQAAARWRVVTTEPAEPARMLRDCLGAARDED